MLNIAIVEDEREAMETLKAYLERFSSERGIPCRPIWFDNPINFLSKYNSSYDLVLLDIELPDLNGMDAARKLREMDGGVALIFVTNMAQYAINGYEVDADDFVVKPVSYFDFAMKLDRVLKKIDVKSDAKIAVSNDGAVKYIAVKDIRYVEVIKHKLLYHTHDGSFEIRGTLKKAEPILLENNFVKCNNYCMVNLPYVSGVKGYVLTVSYGHGSKKFDELLISHPRKKEFVKALNRYLGEKV